MWQVPEYYSEPFQMVRLWLHEVHRVYGDRLTNEQDMGRFGEILARIGKNWFEDYDQDALHAEPLAFTTFAVQSDDQKVYFSISDSEKLSTAVALELTLPA
eukprot:68084-Prymnesium_polylepis.1